MAKPLLLFVYMAHIFTDQTFVQETQAGFSVVDFYADWCGPCKMMAPIYEEVAGMYNGKVLMGKMNVDENPNTPGSFGVQGIPTMVFMKDGKEVSRLVGFQNKDNIVGKLKECFNV